ncbi:MAG: MoaD/ThiS family protein [Spirochaetales bacterium]|nr:MoaD/ThiS family protein [Spirochaetales bacterium]
MARVLVTQPLRRYTGSCGEHEVEGGTVGEVLRALGLRFPELAPKLLRENGTLGAHIIVYVGGRDIRLLNGERTPVEAGSEIKLFAALAGG